MYEPKVQTRREFLSTSLIGSALTWTVPAFLQATIQSLHAAAPKAGTGKDQPILVVLQLAGGNDGLNTVIPIGNDFYYRARPGLRMDEKLLLKVNDGTGLHPVMGGMKELLDDGNLAVLQGVGYPNPNRSHFRSTEIWQTASDADEVESHGWIGKYFDNACAGCDAAAGIALGGETPQAFAASMPRGITFQNAQGYRFLNSDDTRNREELFMELNGMAETATGSSIGSLAGSSDATSETPVDFLERTAMDAQISSDKIRAIAAKSGGRGSYPASRLGRELELVSRLISGGMATRVYYVSHGGFDTHTNQRGTHERLLRELSDATAAFMKDMKAQGNGERVLVMTFSEFGRRVEENASGGTDHGAAAPMFLAGGRVRAGEIGRMPSLDPKDLDDGDLRHSTDFRSVYATVLERHLKVDSRPILGRAFPLIAAL